MRISLDRLKFRRYLRKSCGYSSSAATAVCVVHAYGSHARVWSELSIKQRAVQASPECATAGCWKACLFDLIPSSQLLGAMDFMPPPATAPEAVMFLSPLAVALAACMLLVGGGQ